MARYAYILYNIVNKNHCEPIFGMIYILLLYDPTRDKTAYESGCNNTDTYAFLPEYYFRICHNFKLFSKYYIHRNGIGYVGIRELKIIYGY